MKCAFSGVSFYPRVPKKSSSYFISWHEWNAVESTEAAQEEQRDSPENRMHEGVSLSHKRISEC